MKKQAYYSLLVIQCSLGEMTFELHEQIMEEIMMLIIKLSLPLNYFYSKEIICIPFSFISSSVHQRS